MSKIKIEKFKKNIEAIIEHIDTSSHKQNYIKFMEAEDFVFRNIIELSEQLSKKDINHFEKLKNEKIKALTPPYRIRNLIIPKVINLLISFKIILKIRLLNPSYETDKWSWADKEGIAIFLSTDRNLSDKKYAAFMVKKIRLYMAHFNKPLEAHEIYTHSGLAPNFLKLFFDLENKYGYIDSNDRINYACRVHHILHAKDEETLEKIRSELIKYACQKGYPFKTNSYFWNYRQTDTIPAWCYKDKKYINKFIKCAIFHDEGNIRLELLKSKQFLNAVLKAANRSKQTLLDKQFSIFDASIGESKFWNANPKDKGLLEKLPEIFCALYKHDEKLNKDKINILEENFFILMSSNVIKNWNAVNLVSKKSEHNPNSHIDIYIKNNNYSTVCTLTKTELKKIIAAVFKNEKLKNFFIDRVIGHFFEGSTVHLLEYLDNIQTKIFVICEKILPEEHMASGVNTENVIKNILGFKLPYLNKHKKELRSIRLEDRKKILKILLKSEKNPFNQVAISDCFGL